MFQIRLKNLREERNMSQQKLASEFGLSQSAIGMWESGKREPDFETMKALAQFFNVSVDYLVGNVNDPFFVLDNRRILNDINSTNTGAETPSPAPPPHQRLWPDPGRSPIGSNNGHYRLGRHPGRLVW